MGKKPLVYLIFFVSFVWLALTTAIVFQFSQIWQVALFIVASSIGYAFLLRQIFLKGLTSVKNVIDRLSKDDYTSGISRDLWGSEFQNLAQSTSQLSRLLNSRSKTFHSEHSEKDAIFSSMREGILVINTELRVKYINPSAIKILGLPADFASGTSVQELIRDADILNFIKTSLTKDSEWDGEIEVVNEDIKHLYVHASPLKSRGIEDEVVIVFSDISPIKKLENLRKDFVANVSHELRTPLTSIQGFAETLLQHPDLSPDKRKQFLQIIQNHSGRLAALIEDLLTLSKIEKQAEKKEVAVTVSPVKTLIATAVGLCEIQARAQNIKIQWQCEENLQAPINAPLLEQALVNLIDNAIKYSEPNKEIQIEGVKQGDYLQISVTDQGIGISPEHIDRIFERFYRIDKARSRKVGGTGLGLAIVKHIAMAHGGQLTVKSEINKGSCFCLSLPLRAS